jgi:hypothetical protein
MWELTPFAHFDSFHYFRMNRIYLFFFNFQFSRHLTFFFSLYNNMLYLLFAFGQQLFFVCIFVFVRK